MIKTALSQLQENAETATYFKYELGLHYFLRGDWKIALDIFKGIAAQALPKKFFKTQIAEAQAVAKTHKVPIPSDLSVWEEEIQEVSPDRVCVMPSVAQLAIKIACSYFELKEQDLGTKWLLSVLVVQKKFCSMQSKSEEDFYTLSMKYLSRKSTKMLTYDTYYFMRYMPRLPDESLEVILKDLKGYNEILMEELRHFKERLADENKETLLIIEYMSSMLIVLVCNCLLGETELVWTIFQSIKPYLLRLPDQYMYLAHHMEYWVGRALIEDQKHDEAREVLKSALKRKKCTLNIPLKVKQALSTIVNERGEPGN